MLSDTLWLIVLLFFIIYGLKNPYILFCGNVFVEILKPQSLSFSFLSGKPISMIMVVLFIISLTLNIKKISIPHHKFPTVLILVFMCWITLATYNAQFEAQAWFKYDYVIKTIFFALFIPYVINTKVRLDTFIAILVASLSFFTIMAGIKTLLGGGGYQQALITSTGSNSGMTESSTLSMLAVMNIPFILYLTKYSIFKNKIKLIKPTSYLLILSSLLTIVGSYARTGLVGLSVWLAMFFKKSRYKIRFLLIILISMVLFLPFVSNNWLERMSSIGSANQDASAFGRIVVWRWTIDYVKDKPIMGGGFYAYMANAGMLQSYSEGGTNIKDLTHGKAFHSNYFSVLGELGYVGLFIYLWIIYLAYRLNRKIEKTSDIESYVVLARMSNQALIIYCICGLFISVAYYSWPYYILGIAVSLNHISKCSVEPSKKTV